MEAINLLITIVNENERNYYNSNQVCKEPSI